MLILKKNISRSIWIKLFWGKIEDTEGFNIYIFFPVNKILNILYNLNSMSMKVPISLHLRDKQNTVVLKIIIITKNAIASLTLWNFYLEFM